MSIRILLADDHRLLRRGLCEIISKKMGMDIVGEAEDGQSTIRMAAELQPDLVVMDIGMPDLNGIEATRQIVADNPETKVLALSMHSDRQYVTQMLRAGASGYLIKDAAVEELTRAVLTVSRGQTYLSPEVAGSVVDAHVRTAIDTEDESAYSVLSNREREILQLLAEGRTTKEIAASIHRSVKTVETHRRNIMKKLDLHSVAELTKYAVRQGITELD